MAKKLWGGRFKKPTHPGFERFSSSLPVDCELAVYDLEASRAHANGLARAGILSRAAAAKIVKALDAIAKDLPRLAAQFGRRDIEDVHSLIESELVRRVGDDAKRIHAGRSRNDQVNVATRLYCKRRLEAVELEISRLQVAVVASAKSHRGIVVSGMTHLQKAMPVLWSHWLLCYAEALDRSKTVIADTRRRLDVLTLGSGALAGSGLAIDREAVRKELGFASVSRNSLDAVGSRDFVSETLYALAHLGVNLSRIAEDLLIFQIEELGMVDLPEELCTGSSMMPQKKNADFLELARGASSILIGNSTALFALQKGLPSSYNRDLQWDKEPLFRSMKLVEEMLPIFTVLFKGTKLRPERAAKSIVNDQLAATDLAEALVEAGLPFRDAHERVGRLVREAESDGVQLRKVPDAKALEILGPSVKNWKVVLDPALSVNRKRTSGSTRPSEVDRQIARWEKELHASL
jgi:argininosuccinate lyase